LAQTAARPPTAKELLQQVRTASLDPEQCYRVRDLDLAREDLRIYLTDGYLIFSKPVNGERLSAVFTADVEGGDGEVLLLPPFRGERQSLARFTQSPNLDEHFRAAVLIFSDGAAQALLDRIAQGGGRKAPELGPLFAEQWNPGLANIQSRFDLRLVQDLLTPQPGRPGLLFAAIAGKHLGNFEVFYDLRAPNQIAAGRRAGPEKHYAYDVWTNFPARGFRKGTAKPPEPPFSEERFQIDASLDAGLFLKATVRTSIKTGPSRLRALAFEAAQAVQVISARVDGQPAELSLDDSPLRGNPVTDAQNRMFLVVPETEFAPSSTHEIEFEEQGSVISKAGTDVYFVGARSNWYPRGGGGVSGLAIYDLTFRYPKRLTLVTAGEVSEDRIDGDFHITRRVTPIAIRMAGFNLGDYEKATASAPGLRIEVYGNRHLEAALQPRVRDQEPDTRNPAAAASRPGRIPQHVDPAPPPPPPPNPLARLQAVAADIASSLQFFSGLFGPPALKSLTVSPIPGAFGQGFPGLVYLSTLSYLNAEQRPDALRGPREQVFFSDLIEAHEVAHQWWGDDVIPASYQDEWLSEGLANYSALMYLEKKRGVKAMEDVLEDYRDALLKHDSQIKNDSSGGTLESAGPITWSFRLESAADPGAWHDIVYYKGAWILHMLRRRLGDDRFLKMLAELHRRYVSRAVSTEQFLALVQEFTPPRAPAPGAKKFNAEAFFDNWVYATGIPALKLTYTIKGLAPSVKVSGTIEQSDVEDDFSTETPVEIQFVKGPPQTIWVQTSNDGATFSATLKEVPVKVSIPLGRGVLAVKK
jgi:peptidase M1-like protein